VAEILGGRRADLDSSRRLVRGGMWKGGIPSHLERVLGRGYAPSPEKN